MNIYIPLLPLLIGIFNSVSSTFVSPLIDSDTANSPAFITAPQFFKAINASLPFLATPLSNSTIEAMVHKNLYTYPDFMNYAVKIGNITTPDEMAMYLANVLYQSNGLTINYDPICQKPKSSNCLSLGLNRTVHGTQVNYYGRGYLWIQGQSAYSDCASDLFGDDSTLLLYPEVIRASTTMNWATTAWYWRRFVKPNMTSFGSTIKLIRPDHCNGSSAEPKPEATAAWSIYMEILKILAPTSPPSSSFC